VSKSIATLDYVSAGRAGVRIQLSARPDVAAHFGRRELQTTDDYFAEAADYVEVLRRLWDSWEDDAEIRDIATGRFIDRHKLHYIDFEDAGSLSRDRRLHLVHRRANRSSPHWVTAVRPTN